jgi:hypothetical protein
MADTRTSDFTAKPGGVMTDEVGAVTGDLTLRTEVDDGGRVTQRVQYREADEWYGVTGSPTRVEAGQDIDTIHAQALRELGSAQSP